jgi:hypothetical protein
VIVVDSQELMVEISEMLPVKINRHISSFVTLDWFLQTVIDYRSGEEAPNHAQPKLFRHNHHKWLAVFFHELSAQSEHGLVQAEF